MRTVKKPALRRQEILEGALGVFLEKGYERTTIGDIAGALGISQGLCYRYFSSKEEIYDAVLDACAGGIADANRAARPQDQSIGQWLDSIPHLLEAMKAAEDQNPQVCAFLHSPGNRRMHMELCIRIGEKLLPTVVRVLELANARGELQLTDCAKTAAFGIHGEIGLLMAGDQGDGIREHWRMLLGL